MAAAVADVADVAYVAVTGVAACAGTRVLVAVVVASAAANWASTAEKEDVSWERV